MGTRLGGLTANLPKALVKVAGRELIMRTLDATEHPNVTKRIVVAGYEADHLKKFLAVKHPDVQVVLNPDFKEGSIFSIRTALPHVSESFLIMNVDHIYPKRLMAKVFELGGGINAICDFDRTLGADDMKIKLDANKKLFKIRKTLTDFDGGYIGMTYCNLKNTDEYKKALAETLEFEGTKASVEFILGRLADTKHEIGICDVSGIKWLEVDTNDDLKFAEEKLNNDSEFLS